MREPLSQSIKLGGIVVLYTFESKPSAFKNSVEFLNSEEGNTGNSWLYVQVSSSPAHVTPSVSLLRAPGSNQVS